MKALQPVAGFSFICSRRFMNHRWAFAAAAALRACLLARDVVAAFYWWAKVAQRLDF